MLCHKQFKEDLPHRTGIHPLYYHLTGIDIQLNSLLYGFYGHMPTFLVPLNIFDNLAFIQHLKTMNRSPLLLCDLVLLKFQDLLKGIKHRIHTGEECGVLEVVELLN